MTKDKKVLELVPTDKQIDDDVKKAMLFALDEFKKRVENDEMSELIVVGKDKEFKHTVLPITFSMVTAVGMLEVSKLELFNAELMENLLDE
jgi:hypothetical protein